MTDPQWYSRYSRQLLVEDFDETHQQKLEQASVAIVGMGGLGCAAAMQLAACGTGTLSLIDPDSVDLSNLPRQHLYGEKDIGKAKVHCARARLKDNNARCDIDIFEHYAGHENVKPVLERSDLILDCTDNVQARMYISSQARHLKKPLVSAAATGLQAHVIAFHWQQDACCYGCLHALDATPQKSCLSHGILGPVVAIAGLYQALIAINYLTHRHPIAWGSLMQFCGRTLTWKQLHLAQAPGCPVCQE